MKKEQSDFSGQWTDPLCKSSRILNLLETLRRSRQTANWYNMPFVQASLSALRILGAQNWGDQVDGQTQVIVMRAIVVIVSI